MDVDPLIAGTALVVTALLTWLVLWFFFGKRRSVAGTTHDGVQTANITIQGGYSPSSITLEAGMPTTLVFDRKETGECTSHVVFPDLGIDALLPGNQVTSVNLPALKAGTYPFACGMNMIHGVLTVSGVSSTNQKETVASTADAAAAQHTNDTETSKTAGSAHIKPAAPAHHHGQQSVDSSVSPLDDERRSQEERDKEIRQLTRLVIIGAVLTIPVFVPMMLHMAIPDLIPMWLVNPWLQAILITPVMFYCGAPIHRVGLPALIHRSPDMNSLVTLGSAAAYFFSLLVCIAPQVLPEGSREPYFEAVGVIITLVLLGRLLEAKARQGTGKAVQALIELRPRTAHLVDQHTVDAGENHWRDPANQRNVDGDDLKEGDLIAVTTGERIPTDGVVVAGSATVDESMITGESRAVERTQDDAVTGSTILLTGNLVVRATKVGQGTVLSQIIELVSRAQATKAPVQQLADNIARVFVPLVIVIALWTFAVWIVFGPQPQLAHALVTSVSVLIIACPCALGLATPLSVTAAMGLGARNGVLVTSAKILEQAQHIRTVVFDKTGTITEGKVDAGSRFDKPSYSGDPIKAGSVEAIAALRNAGIRTVMLSGDKAAIASHIAQEVGIDTVIAEVRPDGKAYWIEQLQHARDRQGTSEELIAMVGDGINDAPALAQADVGIAMGTGTDVAMQSADVTLMSGDLRGVLSTMNLSFATMRNIEENLVWAFGYNVIGIPIAAGLLYPFTGWLLSPMIAGLAMALSSLCLVLNANRLRGVSIDRDSLRERIKPAAHLELAGAQPSGSTGLSEGDERKVRVIVDKHETDNAPHSQDDAHANAEAHAGAHMHHHESDSTEQVETGHSTSHASAHAHHHHVSSESTAAPTTAIDPVCGMTIPVTADTKSREYQGKRYYFCSTNCASKFDASPQTYTAKS